MREHVKKGFSGSRHLWKDTFWSVAGKGLSMVFFFLTDIAAARLLSYQEFDEWNYAYAILSVFFWIVWFGLPTSTRITVASFRDSPLKQNSAAMAGLQLRTWISLGFVPVLFSLALFGSSWLGYPEKYPHLRELFIGGIFLIFVNSFCEFFKMLYVGLVDFRSQFVVTVAEYAGTFLFGIGCLWTMRSLNGLMAGYVLGTLSAVLLGFLFLHKHLRMCPGRAEEKEEKEIAKQIFRYAIPFLVSSFGMLVLMEMDSVMLGSMRAGEVGTYAVAKKIVSKATHINMALCIAMTTPFAIITREDVRAKKKLLKKVMGINALATAAVMLIFAFAGERAITTLYGSEFAGATAILNALLFYYFLFSTSQFPSAFMDYQKQGKLRSILFFSVVVLNLALNYWWIPLRGAEGAAWATSLSMLPYTVSTFVATVKIFRDVEKAPGSRVEGAA